MSTDGKDPDKRQPKGRQRNKFGAGPQFSLSLPKPNPQTTQQHAHEVRNLLQGQDIVERNSKESGSTDAATGPTPNDASPEKQAMMSVKNWMKERPIDMPLPAAPMIQFPRMWTSRRGRYCKFKAPGAGTYGLVRARPSF